jgi:hypothetical protein
MKPLRTIAVAGAAAAALLVAQAVTAFAYEQHDPAVASLTAPARSATAKYHSLTVADKDGYSILADSAGITCIAEPHMGAMGVHYVKGDLVKNPMIDPEHPEALVYAPDAHGGLHLAALEYVVIKADWDAHNLPVGSGAPSWVKPAPPNLFGQDFNVTDAPNRYGLPPFYSLHAWVWKNNPAGTFEMWNPGVHCDPPALGRQR